MYTLVAKDWRALSKAASQESDPDKFMQLIEELNDALDEQYGNGESRARDNAPDNQLQRHDSGVQDFFPAARKSARKSRLRMSRCR